MTATVARPPAESLWRHLDFRRLWIAQGISQVGTQVTSLALPLVAAVTLDAGPVQMGILAALGSLPYVLLSFVAGVWVDRLRRRPILVIADLGRALMLATIPLAALFDALSIWQLFVVAFVNGIFSLFFNIAYRSFLPSLVAGEHLMEGNSKLEATSSAALVAGPSIAGLLVGVIGAPAALTIDAVSYLLSGFFIGRIDAQESAPEQAARQRLGDEIRLGLRVVLDNPVLRAVAGCSGTWAFFDAVLLAVIVLFVTRDIDAGAGSLGLIFSALGLGLLGGAFLATPAVRWLGIGRAILAGATFSSIGGAGIAAASGPAAVAVGIMSVGMFLMGIGGAVYQINQMTLRQRIVPRQLQGRMNASFTFVTGTFYPLGFVAGGLLGSQIGLRETLIAGALGGLAGFLWLLFSPIRALHTLPDAP